MFGTIWMFSDQIDDEDLLFAQKSFITIKMAIEYYGIGLFSCWYSYYED